MTISLDMTFDKGFILDRINECLSICASQIKHGFDIPGLYEKSFSAGYSWIYNHALDSGFTETEISDLKDKLFDLNIQCLAQVAASDAKDERSSIRQLAVSTPKECAQGQLRMLCVFFQVLPHTPRITLRLSDFEPVDYRMFDDNQAYFDFSEEQDGPLAEWGEVELSVVCKRETLQRLQAAQLSNTAR